MNKNLPEVTLLIVVRNEIDRIADALESLLNQDYPKEKTEIILVDGFSEDGTRDYIIQQQEKYPDIKFLNNPDKILATGWNLGIKEARGEYVCRIDAHNKMSPDYVSLGIKELLKRENVGCVGGIEINQGTTYWGKISADLYSSKFGAGSAEYRSGLKKVQETDTAKCGVYAKKLFEECGYFDEKLARNQDLEFHLRVGEKGYKFFTHPGMKNYYYVRSSPKKLLKKAYDDGFWTAYSNAYFLRHLIPLFFISYLALSAVIVIVSPYPVLTGIVLIPLFVYLFAAVYYAVKDGKTVRSKLFLPFLFLSYHLIYGVGSFKGHVMRMLKVKVN